MTSILKPGSPMCSRGSPITRSLNWPPYYRGIGATRWLLPRCLIWRGVRQASAVTISHAAEILGEDEGLLWRWLTRWSREDGSPLDHGTGAADYRLHARRDGISAGAARRVQPESVIPAVLSEWLLLG